VFGNAGSLVSFRVGQRDAEVMEREFGSAVVAKRFVDLQNHEVCAKLLSGGQYGEPFTGKTLPPISHTSENRGKIIRRSQEKYGLSREIVENKLRRWMKLV
jgi:hypothetical protein